MISVREEEQTGAQESCTVVVEHQEEEKTLGEVAAGLRETNTAGVVVVQAGQGRIIESVYDHYMERSEVSVRRIYGEGDGMVRDGCEIRSQMSEDYADDKPLPVLRGERGVWDALARAMAGKRRIVFEQILESDRD